MELEISAACSLNRRVMVATVPGARPARRPTALQLVVVEPLRRLVKPWPVGIRAPRGTHSGGPSTARSRLNALIQSAAQDPAFVRVSVGRGHTLPLSFSLCPLPAARPSSWSGRSAALRHPTRTSRRSLAAVASSRCDSRSALRLPVSSGRGRASNRPIVRAHSGPKTGVNVD
jgi:hypothetical protein